MLPTFRWQEQTAGGIVTKVRQGNGLRVYLERPWFSSGALERLGVVIRPDNIDFDSELGQALRPYTTQWGMDPLWRSVAAEPLALDKFVGDGLRETGHNLVLAEVDQPGLRVDVAGYEPGYDTERHLWYANIEMEPGGAYYPFVRLALARFHPISVAGAELSPVVLADFMQVAPQRTITYDLNGISSSTLRIWAAGPSARIGEMPTIMMVHLEARDANVPDPEDELGWAAVTDPVLIPPVPGRPIDDMQWELSLTLPNPRPQPMRVVVKEYERFNADRQPVVVPPDEDRRGGQGPDSTPGTASTAGIRQRLVFADAIVIP